MNKLLLMICMAAMFMACNRQPFVEHKLKFEKIADDCAQLQPSLKLNSNFGGERFEFQKCLPADFTKDQLISERKGDSVVVRFTNLSNQKKVVYQFTLDIDSYPEYNFVTIDDNTYMIGRSKN